MLAIPNSANSMLSLACSSPCTNIHCTADILPPGTEYETTLRGRLGLWQCSASVGRSVNTKWSIQTKRYFHLTAEGAVFLHPHGPDTDPGVRCPSLGSCVMVLLFNLVEWDADF